MRVSSDENGNDNFTNVHLAHETRVVLIVTGPLSAQSSRSATLTRVASLVICSGRPATTSPTTSPPPRPACLLHPRRTNNQSPSQNLRTHLQPKKLNDACETNLPRLQRWQIVVVRFTSPRASKSASISPHHQPLDQIDHHLLDLATVDTNSLSYIN